MKNNFLKLIISFVLLLLLSACLPNLDTIDKSTPIIEVVTPEISLTNGACPFETISPAEVISEFIDISGKSPQSVNFLVDAETNIRVYWNQVSKDSFVLSAVNLNPNLSDNPERKTILESIVGPSSGCVDSTLSAGEYQLNIESADSNWVVVVKAIRYKK